MQSLVGKVVGDYANSRRLTANQSAPTSTSRSEWGSIVVDLCGVWGVDFTARTAASKDDTVLIADGVFAESARAASMTWDEFFAIESVPQRPADRLVIFLPLRSTPEAMRVIERCVTLASRCGVRHACVVTSFEVLFDPDEGVSEWEELVQAKLNAVIESVVVIRAGHIVSPARGIPSSYSRLAPFHQLVPSAITSVFLESDELYAAIDALTLPTLSARRRRWTLLGARRPLREVLAEYAPSSSWQRSLGWVARGLSWLPINWLAGLLFAALCRWFMRLRAWRLTTLSPTSVEDLLSLYNPLNRRHVALAGYNTGVTHFGWSYPGKTVVRTTSAGHLVRVRDKSVTVDAGVLLKRVVAELRARGKELYVVPNYSYISMGTTFMVPVHGSGSEVSTLGDTIEQALIYDPGEDRIRRIKRGDEWFDRWMYHPPSGILVLRLRLHIRDQSRYFVTTSQLDHPSPAEIWRTFADPLAANIELRKTRAADSFVEVRKYHTTPSHHPGSLEIPRDSIGRLWDRLEEHRVTSWLFHTYVRTCGFHVELFLNEREFDIFWRAHAALPLSKIQLRFVNRDGFSNSPCGDADRISVDIFLKRRHSGVFLSFMKEHLPDARFNPGKHSM